METYDEFADINRNSTLNSIKSSLILIAGVGLFILLVFVFINMVTTWSQKIGQNRGNNPALLSAQ